MMSARSRLLIAGALTAITPALTYLWLDLFVSGATFYQGRREWGHVYKHLWTFLMIWPVSVAATLALGLAIIFLATRTGALTASRLFSWTAAASVMLGVAAWGLFTSGQFLVSSFPVAPVLAGYGLLLAAEFVVVGAVPLGGRPESLPAHRLVQLMDRGVFSVAVVATLAGSIVLIGVSAAAVVHGCDCG
jgi:hypothetical protein